MSVLLDNNRKKDNSPGDNASPNVFNSPSATKKVPLKTYVAKGKPTRLITIGEDSRKGSTFIADFDHACILTEPSRRVLFVSNESLAGLVLQQGEWGPWPTFLPFSTAPLSNLSHFFTDGLVPLEDAPVLDLFYRLRWSLENAFHSFADIGGFASLYELLQAIEASDLHLLLSQNRRAGSRTDDLYTCNNSFNSFFHTSTDDVVLTLCSRKSKFLW